MTTSEMTRTRRFLLHQIAAKGADVSVYEVASGLNVAGFVTAYEVETSTGYRAVLSACLSDLCLRAEVPLANCTRELDDRGQHPGQSIDTWCKHVRTHCHGWHEPRVRLLFAAQVAATYGSAAKDKTDPSAGRARLHNTYLYNGRVPQVSTREWAQGEWAQRMERLVAA